MAILRRALLCLRSSKFSPRVSYFWSTDEKIARKLRSHLFLTNRRFSLHIYAVICNSPFAILALPLSLGRMHFNATRMQIRPEQLGVKKSSWIIEVESEAAR